MASFFIRFCAPLFTCFFLTTLLVPGHTLGPKAGTNHVAGGDGLCVRRQAMNWGAFLGRTKDCAALDAWALFRGAPTPFDGHSIIRETTEAAQR